MFDLLRRVPFDEAVEAAYLATRYIAHRRPFPGIEAPTMRPGADLLLGIKGEIEQEEGASLSDIDLATAERYIGKLSDVVEELTSKRSGFDPRVGRALLEQLRNEDDAGEPQDRPADSYHRLDDIWGELAAMGQAQSVREASAVLYSSTRQFVLREISKHLPAQATEQDWEDVSMTFYSEVLPGVISRFDPGRGRFESYFMKSLERLCSREAKKIRALDRAEVPIYTDEVVAVNLADYGLEESANRKQVATILADCIGHLRPIYREVVYLYMNGMRESEIAASLSISPGSCRQRLFRARKMLRACITKSGITGYPLIEAPDPGMGTRALDRENPNRGR